MPICGAPRSRAPARHSSFDPEVLADPLPTGAAKTAAVTEMFDTIAARYDVVNRAMTFGLDTWWRHSAVNALGLPTGSVVADVACGTGDLTRIMERQGLRVVGLDISSGMLAHRRSRSPVVRADARAMPLADGSLHGAICGFGLRNFSDLEGVIRELARTIRPGGRISLLEVGKPRGRLISGAHALWFTKAVPKIGAVLSDAAAYRYLPRSVAYLPAPHELRGLLRRCGFSGVNHRHLGAGAIQLITATRAYP